MIHSCWEETDEGPANPYSKRALMIIVFCTKPVAHVRGNVARYQRYPGKPELLHIK